LNVDLLAGVLFDASGAAVGDGSFDTPSRFAERFPSVRDRTLALRLDPHWQGAYLGVAGEKIAPGIHAEAKSFGLHMGRPIGAFLRQYLGSLASEQVSLRISCDDVHGAPGWFSARHIPDKSDSDLAQDILDLSVSVSPHDEGRLVTVTAHRFGLAKFKPQPVGDLARDRDTLMASILINWSNLHVVFGAISHRSKAYPRRPFEAADHTSLDSLNGERALAGTWTWMSEYHGKNVGVCGWGDDAPYQLWRGWGAPLEPRVCSYGRRADGLVEPDHPHVGLVIPITIAGVKQLLAGATRANVHLASRCGSIGHSTDIAGYAVTEFGTRRRNIEELSGELSLTRDGLRMILDVRLSDYLRETVCGDAPSNPGNRTIHLEYLVPWESLFLAGIGFDSRTRESL
jgi:hypothetical protein